MRTVGQKERQNEQRVVALFRERLGYSYPGNWSDREGNRKLQEDPPLAYESWEY